MDKGYSQESWFVIEVILSNKSAIEVIDIVHELKETGLIQHKDFEFNYHSGQWDGSLQDYKKFTQFKFKDEATATWFTLKYK